MFPLGGDGLILKARECSFTYINAALMCKAFSYIYSS